MKKTNSQMSKLLLALDPSQSQDDLRRYTPVCDSTSCSLNVEYKKTDSTYFCNGGETTSYITGRSTSLSVSIDYDSSSESHKYLRDLLMSDFTQANNQFIKLQLQMNEDGSTWDTLGGKACIQFKSMPPNGNADELGKIEFDIFPQEKWTWTKGA